MMEDFGCFKPSLTSVRHRAPRVPKKSVDLEQYLETRGAFNENIYSESINPSDFTHRDSEQTGEEEVTSDPLVYAPIY